MGKFMEDFGRRKGLGPADGSGDLQGPSAFYHLQLQPLGTLGLGQVGTGLQAGWSTQCGLQGVMAQTVQGTGP